MYYKKNSKYCEIFFNRTIKVKIDYNCSETQNIPSGVGQSSILGPLLFLIFKNDVLHDIQSEIKLFVAVQLLFTPLSK